MLMLLPRHGDAYVLLLLMLCFIEATLHCEENSMHSMFGAVIRNLIIALSLHLTLLELYKNRFLYTSEKYNLNKQSLLKYTHTMFTHIKLLQLLFHSISVKKNAVK